MNTSGDAAEPVVRLSLEGMEVAAKLTGSAAKEVAAHGYPSLASVCWLSTTIWLMALTTLALFL